MNRTYRSLAAGLLWIVTASSAAAGLTDNDKLDVSADFRVRLENDWDSQNSAGSAREDRLRLRVRGRLALQYQLSSNMELGARVRTGSHDSQQSPHITIIDFDDNDRGDAHLNLDKWYIKTKYAGFWGWAGRNSLPIWKPNELFWDDDVTPVGLASGYSMTVGEQGQLGLNVGYFSLPAGMDYSCGNMSHLQLVFNKTVSDIGITAAGGVFNIDNNNNVADSDCARLLKNNGERDYQLWVGNVQAKFDTGSRPLAVGIDVMHNSENYSVGEPGITTLNQNENDGWDVYVQYGGTKTKGEWLVGWWYAYIEQFAVNSSFAQDDWVRWGSATQTAASDMKGHEFRFGYGLGDGVDLIARLYLTEAVTSVEDGKRFRLDLNYKF